MASVTIAVGGYQISEQDCREWSTFPHLNQSTDLAWYGKANMVIWQPGSYYPAPNSEIMSIMEALLQTNGNKWELKKGILWPFKYYMSIYHWIGSIGIPLPFIGFFTELYKIQFAKSLSQVQLRIMTHAVGWTFFLCQPIFHLNEQLHKRRFASFPPDWGLKEEMRDGHWVDIQHIVIQLPPLKAFAFPDKDVVQIMIKFAKADQQAPKIEKNQLQLQARNNPLLMNNFMTSAESARLGLYFQRVFPDLASDASHIITGETLPFYKWQGMFAYHIILQMQKLVNNLYSFDEWKKYWPPLDPRFVSVTIKFKGYGSFPKLNGTATLPALNAGGLFTSHSAVRAPGVQFPSGAVVQLTTPTLFWPVPSIEQEAFLLKMAELQGSAQNGATWQMTMARAQMLITCWKPNGWLHTNESDEWIQAITLENFTSKPSLLALEKLSALTYSYALTFRSYTAGRKRENWIWDRKGDTVNASPVDRYHSCLFRRYQRSSPLLEGFGEVKECIAGVVKGWDEPWTLSKEDLKEYLDNAAPIPLIRDPKPGESSPDYNSRVQRSKGGYTDWRNMVIGNPSVLKEHSVGSVIGISTSGTPILNLYPDYGVWECVDEKTTIFSLLNPYYSTFGTPLYDELIGLARRHLDVLIELYKRVEEEVVVKTLNDAEEIVKKTTDDLLMPVVVFGGLAIGLMITYSSTIGSKS